MHPSTSRRRARLNFVILINWRHKDTRNSIHSFHANDGPIYITRANCSKISTKCRRILRLSDASRRSNQTRPTSSTPGSQSRSPSHLTTKQICKLDALTNIFNHILLLKEIVGIVRTLGELPLKGGWFTRRQFNNRPLTECRRCV